MHTITHPPDLDSSTPTPCPVLSVRPFIPHLQNMSYAITVTVRVGSVLGDVVVTPTNARHWLRHHRFSILLPPPHSS